MRIKEHRIYQYMSEPVRILGMTLDEVGILLGSFFCFLWVESVRESGKLRLEDAPGAFFSTIRAR